MLTVAKVLRDLVMLLSVSKQILEELKQIRKLLGKREPGLVFLKLVKEESEMLFFNLVLPAPGASDVVKRELVVSIAGADARTFELTGDATASEELSGADNDSVVGTLVDIDDAGNRSPAREFSFVLVDTIAPPAPGEVGLTVTREE